MKKLIVLLAVVIVLVFLGSSLAHGWLDERREDCNGQVNAFESGPDGVGTRNFWFGPCPEGEENDNMSIEGYSLTRDPLEERLEALEGTVQFLMAREAAFTQILLMQIDLNTELMEKIKALEERINKPSFKTQILEVPEENFEVQGE